MPGPSLKWAPLGRIHVTRRDGNGIGAPDIDGGGGGLERTVTQRVNTAFSPTESVVGAELSAVITDNAASVIDMVESSESVTGRVATVD